MAAETVVLSDLHIGSPACRVGELFRFLGKLDCERLVLAGDTCDHLDLARWPAPHHALFDRLAKLSRRLRLTVLEGNHDPAGPLSLLLGAVDREAVITSADAHVLVTHGDQFDSFYKDHPWLACAGDLAHRALTHWSPACAAGAKRLSKSYLRCVDGVRRGALARMARQRATHVVCGHTHHPEECGSYVNAGSWTERPCTYVEVSQGGVRLQTY